MKWNPRKSASVAVAILQAFSQRLFDCANIQRVLLAAAFGFAALLATAETSRADENGVSFWIPGFFGSLAAAPQQAGWSLASVYYHTDVSGSGNIAVSREITIGRFNPALNTSLSANVNARADLGMLIPSYVFATPVLGGQASVSLLGMYGSNDTALNGTLSGTLANVPFTRSFALEQTTIGFGDLVPQFALRWNAGVSNYMVYLTGDIPVGLYDRFNLANLGLGHGAIDGGFGYTYFNPATGHEISATLGFTGNFKNTSTDYTSGIDLHLDVGASQFLTKQLQVGVVAYAYEQLTADQGCAPQLCPFKSRVLGIGPQIGYVFPVGGMQGYVNVKAYKEFENSNRPDGWNAWVTFVLSPAPPSAAPSPPPITKAPRS
ncbi:transporter [Bradyrhizobium sp. NP1]|uniref:SphA family protein n=1 Tax=Bradyrhizobium sp. NP1 TaxID=3049772 RepID=UPI0025A591E0|nr:transporter [Bradyrhizobium sp. NP1]WJR76751.1 transporter [Bradyrhizobium sp. NP1]